MNESLYLRKEFVDEVYAIVEHEIEGFDSIYEDYICHLVGEYGLNALIAYGLIESCGVIDDRQMYVLCEKY